MKSILKSTILKNSIVFGIFGAILFAIFLTLAYLITKKPFEANIKSLDFFVYLITLTSSLYWFRFKINQNKMKFWTGMGVGLMTSIVMVLLSSIFIYFFLENIAPQQLKDYIAYQLENLDKIKKSNNFSKQFTKEQFENIYRDMQKVTAYDMAWYEWRVKIIVGVFMSFIISAVLRK